MALLSAHIKLQPLEYISALCQVSTDAHMQIKNHVKNICLLSATMQN